MTKPYSKKLPVEQIKLKLQSVVLPFNIVGAVLFGSKVKGTDTICSDTDIMIIADNINPKRQRRGFEITQIKRLFAGPPLDILLMTPKETVSNFKNHNPLFLDIAEEGIIIFDNDNFLYNLIKETKDYVKKCGIKRLNNGWEFPVKRGVLTYLSGVSNKEFSMAMLKDGERDFLIAKNLLSDSFYDKSVYHFQQSVEKCVKSILIAMGIFQRTHLVGEILRDSLQRKIVDRDWEKKLINIAEISESIEPDVSLSRYPGIIEDRLWLPYEEYEKQDAENALKKADNVLSVAKSFLDYWF